MPQQSSAHGTPDRPVIVVGVDGSASSLGALHWALTESDRGDATVRAAFVFTGHEQTPTSEGMSATDLSDELSIVRLAGDELARAIRRCVGEPAAQRVATVVVSAESTPKGLAQAAVNAQLLVVGASGLRNSIGQPERGAIAALPDVHCPVVVVPSAEPAALAACVVSD